MKKYLLTLKVENFINSWSFDFLTDKEPEEMFIEVEDDRYFIFTEWFSNWLKENHYEFLVDAINDKDDEAYCCYQVKILNSLTEI